MAWNKKRSKGKSKPSAAQEAAAAARRKKEMVLHESVFETALNEFRKNKPFVVKRDGSDLFVGLYMPFERIGGLSSKDKADESKGSIINLINSGRMSVLFTTILNDEAAVIFIPNADTVSAMSEFTCLAEQTVYDIIFVDADEQLEKTDVKINLTQIQRLLDANKSVDTIPAVAELLVDVDLGDGDGNVSLQDAVVEPEVDHSSHGEPDDDVEDDMSDSDGDGDNEPDEPDDYGDSDDDDSDEEPEDSDLSDDGDEPDESAGPGLDDEDSGEADPGYDENAVIADDTPVGDVDVGSELTIIASARRFFNDDLTRSLDTAGLDQVLAPQIVFKPLEKRPGGWLDDQVNAMVDLANKDLYQLHQTNVMRVRQRYLDIMVSAYEQEMRGVLELDADERYARLKELRSKREDQLPSEIEHERSQIVSDWERRVREAGESARQSAENSYRDRYRWQHEDKIRAVALDMQTGMEAAFEQSVAELKAIRKKEAETKLDALDGETINESLAEYETLAKAEMELFEQHKEQILKFLDENRQSEIARINVLAEEHERGNKVQAIEAEYATRVKSLQDEFEARVAALTQDITQMRERHADDIAAKETERLQLENKYQVESEMQQKRIDKLVSELTGMDENKRREVAGQIDNLMAEKDSYAHKYDMLVHTQRRGNRLMAALCIVAVIAATTLGIWGGIFLAKQVDVPVWDAQPQVTDTVGSNPTPGLAGE